MNKGWKMRYTRKAIITSIFGTLFTGVMVLSASAQNVNKEYRDWQEAQARVQRECAQANVWYRNSNRCQAAQRRAQEQYAQYQRAVSRNNGYYNNGYYNNSYYNNGYNNNRYTYRVYRNGSYYSTDYRGAELLKQAVQNGYSQGYQQGRIDSRYSRGYNFGNSSLYRTGTYGYQSYVARDQYQYYFQQGFQRGYEDGFYSRNRYGVRSGSSYNILGNVLNTILNLATE